MNHMSPQLRKRSALEPAHDIVRIAPNPAPKEAKSYPLGIPASVRGIDGRIDPFFTPLEERFASEMRSLIGISGLPLDGIEEVSYQRSSKGEKGETGWRTLGSYDFRGSEKGLLRVTDAVKQPNILLSIHSTLVHELGHSFGITDLKNWSNPNLYKSIEHAQVAYDGVTKLASQSLESGIALNAYHSKIMDNYKTALSEFEQKRDNSNGAGLTVKENEAYDEALRVFLSETHAIVVEMAMTRPKDLKLKAEAQLNALPSTNRGVNAYEVGLTCFGALTGVPDYKENDTIGLENYLHKHSQEMRDQAYALYLRNGGSELLAFITP